MPDTIPTEAPLAAIPELTLVALTRAIVHEARTWPRGCTGTVVHSWSDGEHYAIEFTLPIRCVLSVARSDIERA